MLKNEKGYAILIVFLSIILISVIGLGLLTVSSQSIQTSTNEKVDQSLFFVAEAGLNYATEDIQKKIEDVYLALQDNPPTNFDAVFKAEVVQTILNQYTEANKGTKAPSTLLKASENKKPEIWVADINPNPTDTTKLITFKIYSEGKDINSSNSRKLERAISIPNKLHVVVGNGIPESSYNVDDDNDDKFLNELDKEQEKEAVEKDENKLTEPTGPFEEIQPGSNTGMLYVSDNTRIWATRHQHFNAQINTSSNDDNYYHFVNGLIKYRSEWNWGWKGWIYGYFEERVPTAIFNNTKELWKKFKYKETVTHNKGDNFKYEKSTSSNSIQFMNGTPNTAIENISTNRVYKVPALKTGKTYHITLNLTNNPSPTIVFDKSIIDYDLANVIIEVKGVGTVTVKFDNNYIVSSNKKLIIKKDDPNTKINAIFNKRLAVLGVLEVDGNVTVYRDFKAYFNNESIITGDLYLVSHYIGLIPFTTDLTIYTGATLNVENIFTIDTSLLKNLNPNVRILGRLNANKVYTEDFTSYPLAKINLQPRKDKLTPGAGTVGIKDDFLPVSELIQTTPIVEIK